MNSRDCLAAANKGNQDRLHRDFSIIKSKYPKTSELYKLFLEKGKSIEEVANLLGVSKRALAIVIEGYVQEQKERENASTKEERRRAIAKKKALDDAKKIHISSNDKLIIKLVRTTEHIKIYYVNGNTELLASTNANFKLIKEKIFGYGKHIVFTIESKYITPKQKDNLSKTLSDEQYFEMLCKMIIGKSNLSLVDRHLYLKWKFYFMNRNHINEMRNYQDDRKIQKMIKDKNINFSKLNNPNYTYRDVVQDFSEVSQMYNNAICSEIFDCSVEENQKTYQKRK